MMKFEAVVVSDLHLGARNSRTYDFLLFLESIETDRLILAGDIFDDRELNGLRPADVEVVTALRQMSTHTQVDWLRGNHDPAEPWFSGLLGIPAQDEILLDVGGQSYLVYHGHGWDSSLNWPRPVLATADAVYSGCQWIDPSHRLARMLKRRSKVFCRAVERLRQEALRVAADRSLAGVILGHTHVASDERSRDLHYLNCGCWTETPAAFVGIRRGQARAYYWDWPDRRNVPGMLRDSPRPAEVVAPLLVASI
jgi:UDP-2,3-diacylglucosamine pyrophosphatase LpxH